MAAPSGKPTIFVQIPAYRDPECLQTLHDLFKKAQYPQRIFVGICWQHMPGEDDALNPYLASLKQHLRMDAVDARESRGVCWARHRLQGLYRGEDYTLMIDSHMRMVPQWDTLLIEELKKCPGKKTLLSNHPASYTPPDRLSANPKVTVLRVNPFDAHGITRVQGEVLDKNPPKPLPGAFVAAGFIFAPGRIIEEVPYDPHYYFDEEELCLSARLWTHGWDIFSPSGVFAYHYYLDSKNRKERSLHWDDHSDWGKRKQASARRYLRLFGMPAPEGEPQPEMETYGLGTARSLEQYSAFSGIDFKHAVVTRRAIQCGFIPGLTRYRPPIPYVEPKEKTGMVSGQSDAPKQAQTVISHPDSADFKPADIKLAQPLLFDPQGFGRRKAGKTSAGEGKGGAKPSRRVTKNIPPGVLILENYLEAALCEQLRRYADETIGTPLQVIDEEKTTGAKTVTRPSSGRITEYVPINGKAGEILAIFTDIYTRRLAPFYGVTFEWFERPQILRYLPGGKYNRHADAEHMDKQTKQWVRGLDRDYSVLLYLNEEFEGGELYFPNFDFRIKPRCGMLIGFPSDHRYLHEAEPTLSGKRYSVVSWAAVLGSSRVAERAPYASVMLHLPPA